MKPGYKQSEVGVIPEEWEVCPVRQKGEVLTGKALAANAPGQQRPYLRTKNVFDGRIDIDDVLTMPMTDEQFVQFRIRNGDVLLNEGQSLELVGRCSIYQDEYHEPCAIQNALLRFRARVGVSGKFASYLFRHCQQTGVFAQIALQTTSIAHLGGSRFERLRLAWPTRSIRLNTDLAKKPPECLEYIVVHELMHLLEPTHNARFQSLMDKHHPKWRSHQQTLNRLPVRHESWGY